MRRHDELFAAVYATPDDDAPRGVLADALQEVGDPRGEFIALQLARGRGGKKKRREGQLLKPHLRDWLGALEMVVPNKGLVYERGFVAKCELGNHSEESLAPHLEHVEWATVEEVALGRWRTGTYRPLVDVLPSLRVLSSEDHAGKLASHPKLERIDVSFVYEERDSEHLAELTLPNLRELAIETCHARLKDMTPFFESVASLRSLSVGSVHDAEEWIPWLAKRGYERAGVKGTTNPWMLWFEGDRVTAQYRYSGHQQPRAGAHLAERLEHVPSPNKWHVTVTQAFSWQGANVAAIEREAAAALAGFASYEILDA